MGEKWNLGWPDVHCLPLPGDLKTITTFNLSVLPILRVNSFPGGDLINKSMNKWHPEKLF